MERKTCTKCHEQKEVSCFDRQTKCKDGYRSSCKECGKASRKLHYQNNKEKYKQWYNEFLDRNLNYAKNYRDNYKLVKNGI